MGLTSGKTSVTDTDADTGAGRRKPRRAAGAGLVGTVIEFYDFNSYAILAALVFPHVLFNTLGGSAAVAASVATFGVAFVARPFGSILFGHFGDRLGRKRTLVATLLLMGVATFSMGLVPSADQIGVAAPVLIILLRVVQGMAAGGEWAGAVLFVGEYAPKAKRGLWAMIPTLGATIGFALVSVVFLITTLSMGQEAFLSWGWRLPLLLSAVLVIFGLWLRLSIDETPVFKEEVSRTGTSRFPLLEAIKSQPREIFLAVGVSCTNFLFFVLWSLIITGYAVRTLGFSGSFALGANVCFAIVIAISVVIGGKMSDKFGRRPVLMWTALAGVVWLLALFPLLEVGGALAVPIYILALCVTGMLNGFSTAPCGALVVELFNTRYRYTASAISYNLAAMIAGTLVPLLVTMTLTSAGSFTAGAILAALCGLTAVCAFLLPETRNRDLDKITSTEPTVTTN